MIPLKSKVDIPTATVLSGLIFFSVFCFKLGESVYFDYPSYYISLDFIGVVNLSLKMIVFIFGAIGFLHVIFDDRWVVKKNVFYFVIFLTIIGEAVNIYLGVANGEFDIVDYIGVGPLILAGLGMFYFSVNAFYKCDDEVFIIPSGMFLALIFMALFSFLCGVNYHRQSGSTIWKTNDGEYVIGDYKDGFLLKKCIDGKGVFIIKDYKNLNFIEVSIRKNARKILRCAK